jgi:hypothetical protein
MGPRCSWYPWIGPTDIDGNRGRNHRCHRQRIQDRQGVRCAGRRRRPTKEKEKREQLEREVRELDEELKKVGEVLNDPAKFARKS